MTPEAKWRALRRTVQSYRNTADSVATNWPEPMVKMAAQATVAAYDDVLAEMSRLSRRKPKEEKR